MQCGSALEAAIAYQQMCERNDVKLRHIFQQHLNSVRVKIERLDEKNDNEAVYTLEEHWFDDKISEAAESVSEDGDNWSAQADDDIEKIDKTCDLTSTENSVKIQSSSESNNQSSAIELAEILKHAKCENGSWICKLCSKAFRNRRTLKLHVRRQGHLNQHGHIHGSNSFKINRQPILRLKREKTADDGGDEDVKLVARAQCVDGRWVCEICRKTFADRTTLKLHIRVHLGINLKQCPVCPKGFAKQSFLDFHMKSHEERMHLCQSCDSAFNTKQALREHASDAHSKEKQLKSFMCEVCSKVFNRANTLNQHRITHTGEKKFSCEICHRKVGTKASLQWVYVHSALAIYLR